MLGEILKTWIYQMGYPLVLVRRSATNPSIIEVTQEYFLIDRNETKVNNSDGFEYE